MGNRQYRAVEDVSDEETKYQVEHSLQELDLFADKELCRLDLEEQLGLFDPYQFRVIQVLLYDLDELRCVFLLVLAFVRVVRFQKDSLAHKPLALIVVVGIIVGLRSELLKEIRSAQS